MKNLLCCSISVCCLQLVGVFLYADFAAKEDYQQYVELHWLASTDVEATQEGSGKSKADSFSKEITGAFYPELDRTLLALQCLEWFWDGGKLDYENMTQGQNYPRLIWESFLAMHEQLTSLTRDLPSFSKETLYDALRVNIVIGDLGKSVAFRNKMESLVGIQTEDHDVFLGEVLQQPSTLKELPSFQNLPQAAQELIRSASEVGHFGHMSHLEGGPNIFARVKEFLNKHEGVGVLKFAYMGYVMDTAAAAGHVAQRVSLVFNEDVYRVVDALWKSLLSLSGNAIEVVYAEYLRQRGQWIGVEEVITAPNFLIARLACLMRLYTPGQGTALREALMGLTSEQLIAVQSYFYIDLPKYADSQLAKEATPTYMPAVLVNLINNPTLGNTQNERIQQAAKLGVTFLARVLLHWRTDANYNPNLIICFNPIAKIAKDAPEKLASHDFTIDIQTGYVMLKE